MKGKLKNITLLIFAIWVTISLAGCLKDISGEIPANDPKITVNCFFNPNIPIIASISKSKSILESGDNHYLLDAKGYIYENDVLVDSIIGDATLQYHISQQFYIPQEGKNYRIEIHYPGYDTVKAGTILPYRTPIQSVDLDTIFYAPQGHKTYTLKITFNDDGSQLNYYHLMVYRNRLNGDGTWAAEPLCFVSDDAVFEAMGKNNCVGGMFTDVGFNGQQKEIIVNTKRRLAPKLNDSVQFLVELRNGSLPYYEYNKSLTIFKNGQYDIFVQPAPIIGNVLHGYGIFAGYAPVTDTVKLN